MQSIVRILLLHSDNLPLCCHSEAEISSIGLTRKGKIFTRTKEVRPRLFPPSNHIFAFVPERDSGQTYKIEEMRRFFTTFVSA